MNPETKHWDEFIRDRNAPYTANDLAITVKRVMGILVFGKNISFVDLSVEASNGMHLCVALRASFVRRDETEGWDTACTIAKESLIRDGLNWKEVMVGLIV